MARGTAGPWHTARSTGSTSAPVTTGATGTGHGSSRWKMRLSKEEAVRIFGEKVLNKLGKEPKRLKYNNQKCTYKGQNMDSIHERDRFIILEEKQAEGLISGLKWQVPFELIPVHKDDSGKTIERACVYIADFTYYMDGQLVVEDAKSEITRKNPAYIIKRKLMLDKYGIKIVEV